MNTQDYISGDWVDSNGSVNPVKFKKIWGGHIFSEDESRKLLSGEVISFPYKYGTISGRLQYCKTKEGRKYFGFCPDFKNYNYTDTPIYDPSVESRYEGDRMNEALINQFMRMHYYSKLLNSDGTNVESEFINDVNRQKQGVDVIFTRDKKSYIIDEKAQMLEYAKRISSKEIGQATYDVSGEEKDFRYGYDAPADGFNKEAYLVYSIKKYDGPVNLVVKREWLQEIAESCGEIDNKKETDI